MAEKAEYDPLVEGHDEWRHKSNKIWILEMHNVLSTMAPFLPKANVLELACGSGFYTYDLIKWGAESVLGVDISSGMLDAARRLPDAAAYGSKVSFLHEDCTKEIEFPGAPFDLVFAAYLLPHAPDRKTMIDMYKTVLKNLKNGGKFFAVVSPVSEDPKAFFEREKNAMAEFGLTVHREFVKEIDDGITYRIKCKADQGDQYFYGYRLRKSVYEEAAKEAGFSEDVQWIELLPPVKDGEDLSPEEKKQIFCPDFSILVVKK